MSKHIAATFALGGLLAAGAAHAGAPLKGVDVKLGKQASDARCMGGHAANHARPCAAPSASPSSAPTATATARPIRQKPHGSSGRQGSG
ncbi:MAG TPA: hypothetical protein VF418_00355 [Sphingomonadaceae bacterium]